MTRDDALKRLEEPLYLESDLKEDLDYVLSKLDMSNEEFEKIMKEEPKSHLDYSVSIINKFVRYILISRKFFFNY